MYPSRITWRILVFLAITHCACAGSPESDAKAIAKQSGFSYWSAVEKVTFTYNEIQGGKQTSRTWTWSPETEEVTLKTSGQDPVTYRRMNIPANLRYIDGQFAKDQFLLLLPFYLVWDNLSQITKAVEPEPAPISGEPVNLLTIEFAAFSHSDAAPPATKSCGYSRGDRCDVFYDDNFNVQGIHFYRKGESQPTLTTTWEAVGNFGGLQISQERNMPDTGKIYFTNVSVKFEGNPFPVTPTNPTTVEAE